jgi:hypothetical protein
VTRTGRGAVAAAALLLAACSGGGSGHGTTSTFSGSPTTAGTPTTPSITSPGETTAPDTSVAPQHPVYPLTGLPVSDSAAASRPALVVMIDNNAAARPQSGLDEADIVFEELVEVQTRFAAVFQSHGADPVGPIRSGRTQDVALLGSLDKPLFAWSGGNPNVTRFIHGSDFVDLNAQRLAVYNSGGFYRSTDRVSPHNLYAESSKLWSLAPAGAAPPPQQFQYRQPGDAVADGSRASGVSGAMGGLQVDWAWDASRDSYTRSSDGQPHRDALGGLVTTDNVVVMEVVYRPSPADARSPEAQTVGTGRVLVFTGGDVVEGTWSRTDRLSPMVLTDRSGAPITLTPGRTWVEVARAGSFSAST